MRAEQFSGYEGLKLVDLPKPAVTEGRVLVRITAAGVTPLDYTILTGKFHGQKPPLVLGNEGAGVVEACGSKMAPLREPLGQPAETGVLAVASNQRRRRQILYFQSSTYLQK
jgi:NADPH:quinone reductase-like Zn-dependent oxidoreductase